MQYRVVDKSRHSSGFHHNTETRAVRAVGTEITGTIPIPQVERNNPNSARMEVTPTRNLQDRWDPYTGTRQSPCSPQTWRIQCGAKKKWKGYTYRTPEQGGGQEESSNQETNSEKPTSNTTSKKAKNCPIITNSY
ncbi:hypothetical protein Bca52824_038950 [Brassica carinata]|uniref:Uncharacterized protein n=1 Tax=Brassica carinata TaxID=52824 RepID=A0A8X7UXP1_BRACI|nr:hypothetical protein Bca52824_038950 [Brassica carinata]